MTTIDHLSHSLFYKTERGIDMTYRKKAYPYSDEGSFPILAEFHDAEDAYAFERTSGKRDLKNPSGSCTTPHEEGGKGSGDGTCYQKHREYGVAGVSGGLPPAGEDGSAQRAEYMKKYRKVKGLRKTYDGKPVTPNENGKWDRENGPVDGESTPRKETVPRPFGKSHDRGSEKTASEIRLASLEYELLLEQNKLLRLASENPLLRDEVMFILKEAHYTHPYNGQLKSKKFDTSLGAKGKQYKRTKSLLNPRSDAGACFKQFKEWSYDDWDEYAKDLWNGNDEVHGKCYQIHSDYGEWGGASSGSDKEYQKWYNDNVRQYGGKKTDYKGPKSSGKKRTKDNRQEMVDNALLDRQQFIKLMMINAPKKVQEEIKEKIEEVQSGKAKADVSGLASLFGKKKEAPASAPASAPAPTQLKKRDRR